MKPGFESKNNNNLTNLLTNAARSKRASDLRWAKLYAASQKQLKEQSQKWDRERVQLSEKSEQLNQWEWPVKYPDELQNLYTSPQLSTNKVAEYLTVIETLNTIYETQQDYMPGNHTLPESQLENLRNTCQPYLEIKDTRIKEDTPCWQDAKAMLKALHWINTPQLLSSQKSHLSSELPPVREEHIRNLIESLRSASYHVTTSPKGYSSIRPVTTSTTPLENNEMEDDQSDRELAFIGDAMTPDGTKENS